MYSNSITFDELPGAVSSLVSLVRELADEVRELRAQLASGRNDPKSNAKFIGIEKACEILGKAKSTIYRLAKEGKLPAYKKESCLPIKFRAKKNGALSKVNS